MRSKPPRKTTKRGGGGWWTTLAGRTIQLKVMTDMELENLIRVHMERTEEFRRIPLLDAAEAIYPGFSELTEELKRRYPRRRIDKLAGAR